MRSNEAQRPDVVQRLGAWTFQAQIVAPVWSCDHHHRTRHGADTCARKQIDKES
ncbi:hypothetical protein [Aeromicrobium sp.]|uniref:hypothetical protein n=1 Tax=Aeromicrobium sp. TaxID=1871063 RepID=UPI002FC59362